MKFLTSEKDLYLVLQEDGIVYFYSSNQSVFISEMMHSLMSELNKNNNILCIDLFYFKNIYKRFDITEIPTILIIKGGKEIKRIIGVPSINNFDNILSKA
jgi:hypothetical protein